MEKNQVRETERKFGSNDGHWQKGREKGAGLVMKALQSLGRAGAQMLREPGNIQLKHENKTINYLVNCRVLNEHEVLLQPMTLLAGWAGDWREEGGFLWKVNKYITILLSCFTFITYFTLLSLACGDIYVLVDE